MKSIRRLRHLVLLALAWLPTLPAFAQTNTSPTVSLSASNSPVVLEPGSVALYAQAFDLDGSIIKVEYYQGATLIATTATNHSVANVSGLPGGSYTFYAIAYDNQGASTSSSPIAVIVNRAPSVSMTAPANYAVLASGSAVSLSAAAADSDGQVAKVEFYRGSTLIGQVAAPPYSLNVSGLPNGPYAFGARVYDNHGATTDSAVVNVTIGAATAMPVTYSYDGLGRLIGVQR